MRETQKKAAEIRKLAFRLMKDVGGGHYGGNLSEIEILTTLYDGVMNVSPSQLEQADRDRFVMSKGHGGFGLYSVLSYFGFVDYEFLSKNDQNGVMIPKHASTCVPGVEVSTGSLGQGLSIAVGMALAAKADRTTVRVYTMLGDGECGEGQVWEAAMTAGKYGLDNLTAVIDNNRLAFDGPTEDVMPLAPFSDKWRSFGWRAVEVDGHDTSALREALESAKRSIGKPVVIIANTVKGKGISYMEGVPQWHAGSLTAQEYTQGMEELEAVQ